MKNPSQHARKKNESRGKKQPIDSFFRLGTIHIDSELLTLMRREGVKLENFLERHGCGDCGEACNKAKSRNMYVLKSQISEDFKIKRSYLIVSLYSLPGGEQFCIATKSLGRGTVAAFTFQIRKRIGRLGMWASDAINAALGK